MTPISHCLGLTLNVVQFRFVHIHKKEDDETDKTHAEQEDERHVGVASGGSRDGGGDKRTDKTLGLSDSVEKSKEEVCFRSGNHFSQEGDLVRCPGSHLELYGSAFRTRLLMVDLRSKLERPRIPILIIS